MHHAPIRQETPIISHLVLITLLLLSMVTMAPVGHNNILNAQTSGLFGSSLIADITEKSSESVVSIETVTYENRRVRSPYWELFSPNIVPKKGQGSGVLIDAHGHILTNRHVIENAHEIRVTFKNGKSILARLTGEDEESDLAILKINRTDQKWLEMGDSNSLRPGEWTLVIGNPLGLGITVTVGVISAVKRQISLGKNRCYKNFIQTDAAINPGNSGGPLINSQGKIIGIATAVVQHYRGANYQNIGFAIPINKAKRVVEDLIEFGKVKKSFIGIGISNFEQGNSRFQKGVLVERVYRDTSAHAAGIKAGDSIYKVNGLSVTSVQHFGEVLKNFRVGERVNLKIQRDKTPYTIQIKLKEAPNAEVITIPLLGIKVAKINRLRIIKYQLRDKTGVVITQVYSNSVGNHSGLLPGDIIQKINDYAIKTPEEFKYAMSQISSGENILLLIVRGNSRRYLVVKIT